MESFASDSTIHGVNYIFGENRGKIVRIFWLLLLIASFGGFCFYFQYSYLKYSFAPDIAMKREEKHAVNFPMAAITFCPKIITTKKTADLIAGGVESNQTRLGCDFYSASTHWCEPMYDTIFQNKPSCPQTHESMDDINVVDLVNKSSSQFEEIISDLYACQILTHNGFCSTTNIQDITVIFNEDLIHDDFWCYRNKRSFLDIKAQWTVDQGYFVKNDTARYPMFINLRSLFVYEKELNSEMEFCSSMSFVVHLPSEMPTEFHKFIPITYGSRIAVIVTAKSHRTDDALHAYPPKVRNCYFQGEKKLEFFKTYSKAHCQLECSTSFTLKSCGCVLFWMPRSKKTPVCKFSDITCVQGIRDYRNDKVKPSCDCLSPCNDLKYEIELMPTYVLSQPFKT